MYLSLMILRTIIAGLLTLNLVSCTTNSPADPSKCSAPDVTATGARLGLATGAVVITAQDNYFEPACTEVSDMSELTLVVNNEGRYPHDLTLPNGGAVRVDGGQTAFLTISPDTNQIRFTCTIHPGMDGRIEITGE